MGLSINRDVEFAIDQEDLATVERAGIQGRAFLFARMRRDVKALAYAVIAPNQETAEKFFGAAVADGPFRELRTLGTEFQLAQVETAQIEALLASPGGDAEDPGSSTPEPGKREFRSCCTVSAHVPVLLVGQGASGMETTVLLDRYVQANFRRRSPNPDFNPVTGIRISTAPVGDK